MTFPITILIMSLIIITMDVDPTRARVQVITHGEPYGIIIKDQDGLPLDFSLINNTLTIDTLGASSITISYRIPVDSNETEFVPVNQTTQDTSERYITENSTAVDIIELDEINPYVPAYILGGLFIITVGLLLIRKSRKSKRYHEWRIGE